MVFNAYLDPRVIAEAYANRPYGFQCLIALLRSVVQNCCIVDLNGELSAALASQVRAMPRDAARWMLEKILTFLREQNRFVPRTDSAASLDEVIARARDWELDVVITGSDAQPGGEPRNVEVCSLASFQFTEFEHERSSVAQGGATFEYDELSEFDFLNLNFRKALRNARWINVCDGSLGQNFNANYRYTVEKFIEWLFATHTHGRRCRVAFLCLAPTLAEDNSLPPRERRPDSVKRGELEAFINGMGAEAVFYRRLPHERFFHTDQFAFEVGRGMDFLHPGERNRDVSIATKNSRQVEKLFASCDRFRVA
jgi:hypothetical protein